MRKYSNREMEWNIEQYVHSARNRTILKLIYIDDLPIERVAEIYELSPRAVDYIVRQFKDVAPIFR